MIPFTQFMMPDGRKVPVTIDRPAAVEAVAREIMRRGYRFEIEVLTTGEISMEIVRDVEDPDAVDDVIAGELCDNGPQVPEAVDRMIAGAAQYLEIGNVPECPQANEPDPLRGVDTREK